LTDGPHDLRRLCGKLLDIFSCHGRELGVKYGLERDVEAVAIVWAAGVAGFEGASRRLLWTVSDCFLGMSIFRNEALTEAIYGRVSGFFCNGRVCVLEGRPDFSRLLTDSVVMGLLLNVPSVLDGAFAIAVN
jgi:hypothetical protein